MDLPVKVDAQPTTVTALKERVRAIRATIDFSNRLGLTTFGEKAQKAATSFADRILASAAKEEQGDPDAVLMAMLSKAKELDPKDIQPRAGFIAKFLDRGQDRVSRFRARFSDVAAAIDEMAINIERHREALRSDIHALEGLYQETMRSIEELDDHIEAAQGAIQEMREVTIPAMRSDGGVGRDEMMAAQMAMDAEQATDRLEKRLMQLRQARQIAFQQLPQIRIVQSGDETLIQNLDAALDLTIPAWKQKMVVVLGISRQGAALRTESALADATGRLMTETAQLVQAQAFQIEDRAQKGIVDVAALETTNAILIETISGLLAKQAEGRTKRKEVGERIEAMNRELGEALATQANRSA